MLGPSRVFAQSLSETAAFTERFAQIQNSFDNDSDLEAPLEELLKSVENYKDANPDNASSWIVLARVKLAYANTQGIIKGMRIMKQLRGDLEQSLSIDPLAEQGLGQALLGFLYVAMPPWPLGFGNKSKGEHYLAAAYELNSDGMEINYYYAQYHGSEKNYVQALQHVKQATQASYGDGVSPHLSKFYKAEIEELQANIESRLL
ncbi:MAG: hypothetical protein COC19_04180 [SAR86 cluster bacterium]|uniref:Tetratricopeptide repeat protein n=1 Tax=SAR86 cluster bacterium TaxID=2030880 RepID=A0A2A4MNI7_9GAMM|nr:MAG: hypothetical protein COC19_04180 [SAR86 cluster bacterium]